MDSIQSPSSPSSNVLLIHPRGLQLSAFILIEKKKISIPGQVVVHIMKFLEPSKEYLTIRTVSKSFRNCVDAVSALKFLKENIEKQKVIQISTDVAMPASIDTYSLLHVNFWDWVQFTFSKPFEYCQAGTLEMLVSLIALGVGGCIPIVCQLGVLGALIGAGDMAKGTILFCAGMSGISIQLAGAAIDTALVPPRLAFIAAKNVYENHKKQAKLNQIADHQDVVDRTEKPSQVFTQYLLSEASLSSILPNVKYTVVITGFDTSNSRFWNLSSSVAYSLQVKRTVKGNTSNATTISTENSPQSFKETYIIQRQYSDFYTLYHSLATKYPSFAGKVASLPSKRWIVVSESAAKSIVEERRQRFQQFLNDVLADQVYGKDPDVAQFLQQAK